MMRAIELARGSSRRMDSTGSIARTSKLSIGADILRHQSFSSSHPPGPPHSVGVLSATNYGPRYEPLRGSRTPPLAGSQSRKIRSGREGGQYKNARYAVARVLLRTNEPDERLRTWSLAVHELLPWPPISIARNQFFQDVSFDSLSSVDLRFSSPREGVQGSQYGTGIFSR